MGANSLRPCKQRDCFVLLALTQICRSQILEDYRDTCVVRWQTLLADRECPLQRDLSLPELLLVALCNADPVQICGNLQTLWPVSLFVDAECPFT